MVAVSTKTANIDHNVETKRTLSKKRQFSNNVGTEFRLLQLFILVPEIKSTNQLTECMYKSVLSLKNACNK